MKVELIAITENAEKLIERAARTCYQSNSLSNESSANKLLPRLIESGHESPFEHASATFCIAGVSRAMTHQLVRHRLLAVSQKSQRYVSEKTFEFVTPPSIEAQGEQDEFAKDMADIQVMYQKWIDKKVLKEDARFVLPNSCTTEIMITGNFREFRHIFKIRCTRYAQWEIREVCCIMLKEMYKHAPLVFGDIYEEIKSNYPELF